MKNKINEIISFIRTNVYGANFDSAVVGISGGIDSAVVAALASKSLGGENVYGMILPYGRQKDIDDSYKVIEKFGIKEEYIDIKPMVSSFGGHYEDMNDLRWGNIKARVRMIWLYDMAKRQDALVLGTCNRSELLMGYFTLHGDGACDVEPIAHLYKTEVREMASQLGVPASIIYKPPSAGLWDGQTDEEELGMTYEEMDKMFMKVENMSFKMNLPKMMVRNE